MKKIISKGIFVMIFGIVLVGCGNNKKEFTDNGYLKFNDASIKPKYLELKKSDGEIWFAFDFKNDFSQSKNAPFVSKMIKISAVQNSKELKMSDKTEDDFSDQLSSVYEKVEKGEENFIIYIFNTDDFNSPVTIKFDQTEGKQNEVTLKLK